MRPRPPPNARLSAAHALGVAIALLRAPPLLSFLLLTAALLVWTWRRPDPRLGLAASTFTAALLGLLSGQHAVRHEALDCRLEIADGATASVVGWFEARPSEGSAPFRIVDGLGCTAVVSAYVASGDSVGTGDRLRADGRWTRWGDARTPRYAGSLRLSGVETVAGAGPLPVAVRIRGAVEARVLSLFPSEWALLDALLLGGRSGLDRELRDRFSQVGVIHLLAISGFHVGVVAALIALTLRVLRLPVRWSAWMSSAGVVAYVAFLGFPSAATRAGLLVVVLALARTRGKPVAALGALCSVMTLLLILDPLRLGDPGFQLSFAGAAGLVVLGRPLRARLEEHPVLRTNAAWLTGGLATGLAATLATLPLVAFHFGRVSVVGVPATLMVAPLVALAIPWAILALLLDLVAVPGASFTAGAAEALLWCTRRFVEAVGGLGWIAPSVGVTTTLAVVCGCVLGWVVTSGLGRVRQRVRLGVVGAFACGAVLLVPVGTGWSSRGMLEVVVLDVGQGDAILVGAPDGRWALIDAGPSGAGGDAGAEVVEPFLRRRGVRRLDRVFFTHADQDHIGGGPHVLRSFDVTTVIDPTLAVAKSGYRTLLGVADSVGVEWVRARPGQRWSLGAAEFEVLAPRPDGAGGDTDTNDASVVLLLRYRGFVMLLTGDAPSEVEDALVGTGRIPDIDVLKVGHHGSTTSTGDRLLEGTTPELAIVSVGRRNRYGHPHPEVISRLQRRGVSVRRTDRDGTVRVLVDRSGAWRLAGSGDGP